MTWRLGGDLFERLLQATRPLGRMVLLGASSGKPPAIPSFDTLRRRNVGVLPFSFGMMRKADTDRVAKLAEPALELLRSARVAPPVGLTLPLAEAAQALTKVANRETVGKVLLAP